MNNNKRIGWDEYFVKMAQAVSARATCPRKSVGAIVCDRNNRVVGTGYNGAPIGMEHCHEVGCLIVKGIDGKDHCVRVVHAEMNAILQAGQAALGGTLYTTASPCPICFKLLIQVGIRRVFYKEDFNLDDVGYWIENSGVRMIKWTD